MKTKSFGRGAPSWDSAEDNEFDIDGEGHAEMELGDVMEYSEDLKDAAQDHKASEKISHV